jgi:NTE family protein
MEISTSGANAGVVLSGGGAFGAYEAGVINALCHGLSPSTNNTPLDAAVFAGTSVGAFNAAVLAMNVGGPLKSAEALNDLWLHTIPDKGDGRGNSVYRIRGDVANYLDPRLPGSPVEQLARALSDAGAFGSLFARTARVFFPPTGRF